MHYIISTGSNGQIPMWYGQPIVHSGNIVQFACQPDEICDRDRASYFAAQN
jgi:hypothetical protein